MKVVFERSKVKRILWWIFLNVHINLVRKPEPLSKTEFWDVGPQNIRSPFTIIYWRLPGVLCAILPCHKSGAQEVKSNKVFIYGYFLNVNIKRVRRPDPLSKTESRDVGPQKVQTPFTIIYWMLPGVLSAILPSHESGT
jgi:hypothetical protein